MRTLFERFVAEMDVGADGLVRPRRGAAWRWEAATGESGIHRRLAMLVDAPASMIAAFASAHGKLRLNARVLYGAPEPAAREATHRAGQATADDIGRVIAWYESGCSGPAPESAHDVIAVAALIAGLPEPTHRAMDLVLDDAPETEVEAVLEPQGGIVPDPATFVSTMLAAVRPSDGGAGVAAHQPEQILAGLKTIERFALVMGGLAESPEALTAGGGPAEHLRRLIGALPEALAYPELADERSASTAALMAELASESIDDWREAARFCAEWVRAVDLVRRALSGGLTPAEKQELGGLLVGLVEWEADTELTAADLADRAHPLMRARIEWILQSGGTWPVRRGSVAGLFWRAFVALWMDLTGEQPPAACGEVGCGAVIPSHGNRRLCDWHQAEHKRLAMQKRRRDGTAHIPAAGGERRLGQGPGGR